MKVLAVIPARYGSTRMPGNSVMDIHGKPVIRGIFENVNRVREFDQVVVPTDVLTTTGCRLPVNQGTGANRDKARVDGCGGLYLDSESHVGWVLIWPMLLTFLACRGAVRRVYLFFADSRPDSSRPI